MSTIKPEPPVVLDVRDLRVHFPITRGVLRRTVGHVKAVDGVTFQVRQAETLGLVGESGCGKTTTGRALLRIVEPTGGEISFRRADGQMVDVRKADKQQLRALRRDMRMVFQDPNSSLNPRLPVGEIIGEPLKFSGVAPAQIEERVVSLLKRVGLRPEYLHRYPHAFSGGERQRIDRVPSPSTCCSSSATGGIGPRCRQAQVLKLLRDLKRELDLTYPFVGHDLAVIQHICDRVASCMPASSSRSARRGPSTRPQDIPIPKRSCPPCPSPTLDCGRLVRVSGSREMSPTCPTCRPAAHFIRAAAMRPIAARSRSLPCGHSPTARARPAIMQRRLSW